jgi:hypothetical protein
MDKHRRLEDIKMKINEKKKSFVSHNNGFDKRLPNQKSLLNLTTKALSPMSPSRNPNQDFVVLKSKPYSLYSDELGKD